MNYITIIIGIFICLVGLYVQYRRLTERSKKKPILQKFMGKTTGSFWHFTSYVVLPSVLGLIIIYYGLNGLSISDLLNTMNMDLVTSIMEENIAQL